MKRQLLTFAAAAAVALCTIVACSKKDNSNPEKLSLNNGQMSGQDDDPASSISECFRRFTNTIKNKPEDYIPGDAENAFTDCVNGFIDLHNGGGTSLKPPADPAPDGQWDPFFPAPPTNTVPYIDGEKLICDFFGLPYPLTGRPSNVSIGKWAKLTGDIYVYNKIIADATFADPLSVSARDRANVIITHVYNNGYLYLGLNKEQFFDYMLNVVLKYNSKLSIRTQFADVLSMNDANFRAIFNEVTDRIYP